MYSTGIPTALPRWLAKAPKFSRMRSASPSSGMAVIMSFTRGCPAAAAEAKLRLAVKARVRAAMPECRYFLRTAENDFMVERKSVVEGRGVSVSVDPGWRRSRKNTTNNKEPIKHYD